MYADVHHIDDVITLIEGMLIIVTVLKVSLRRQSPSPECTKERWKLSQRMVLEVSFCVRPHADTRHNTTYTTARPHRSAIDECVFRVMPYLMILLIIITAVCHSDES